MKYRKLVLSRINTFAVLRNILMYSILEIKGGGGGMGGGEPLKSAKEYTERFKPSSCATRTAASVCIYVVSGLNFMKLEKAKVFY